MRRVAVMLIVLSYIGVSCLGMTVGYYNPDKIVIYAREYVLKVWFSKNGDKIVNMVFTVKGKRITIPTSAYSDLEFPDTASFKIGANNCVMFNLEDHKSDVDHRYDIEVTIECSNKKAERRLMTWAPQFTGGEEKWSEKKL